MQHHYQCYGVQITSDIECALLPKNNHHSADVTIRITDAPDVLTNAQKIGLGLQVDANNILLTIANIARYHMQNGHTIHVMPDLQSDPKSVQHFLLSAALPYLMVQRGCVVLRGIAFTMYDDTKAHVILGNSGSGKSTLLAALCQKGAKILTDQYVVLTQNKQNQLCVEPAFPSIKLWHDACHTLALPTNELILVREQIKRYYWSVASYFVSTALPIDNIFLLEVQNLSTDEDYKFVKGYSKLQKIKQNQYAEIIMRALGSQKSRAQTLFQLANQCKIFELARTAGITTIDELICSILSALKPLPFIQSKEYT